MISLGADFLKKIYERALIEELRLRGLRCVAQSPFPVSCKGKHIGTYAADLVIEDCLLVEVKCVEQLASESGLHLALLINFRRSKVEWRRMVHNL